jgi:hypothetical protein
MNLKHEDRGKLRGVALSGQMDAVSLLRFVPSVFVILLLTSPEDLSLRPPCDFSHQKA